MNGYAIQITKDGLSLLVSWHPTYQVAFDTLAFYRLLDIKYKIIEMTFEEFQQKKS